MPCPLLAFIVISLGLISCQAMGESAPVSSNNIPPSSPLVVVQPLSARSWPIALTFDDGPSHQTTPEVLSILEKMHVPATFFVVGRNAKANPAILQRMDHDGDVIGNHTWSHRWLTKLSDAAILAQITKTNVAIDRAVPGYQVKWFRVPYGAVDATLFKDIYAQHLSVVWWTADDEGWRRQGVSARVKLILQEARPEGVILMHDTELGTVVALPQIITALRAKGAVFVTVPELLVANKIKTLPRIIYPIRGLSVIDLPPAIHGKLVSVDSKVR